MKSKLTKTNFSPEDDLLWKWWYRYSLWRCLVMKSFLSSLISLKAHHDDLSSLRGSLVCSLLCLPHSFDNSSIMCSTFWRFTTNYVVKFKTACIFIYWSSVFHGSIIHDLSGTFRLQRVEFLWNNCANRPRSFDLDDHRSYSTRW